MDLNSTSDFLSVKGVFRLWLLLFLLFAQNTAIFCIENDATKPKEHDSPIFTSSNIATFPENGTGTVIDINANDGEGGAIDSSVEYTLGGADAGDFDLTASGLLTFKQIPDYDAPEDAAQDNLYRLTVTAEKTGGSSTVQELTIVIIPLVEEGININNQLGTSISAEASGDHFGFSVSVNSTGQIMAVGGISNDGTGSNAGHVRVYEYQSSGWVQLGSDINGRAIGDELGRSVSLSYDGTLLAVGATGNDDVASNSGQVQVYRWNGSHWVEHGSRINGLSEDAFLGRSVSLNADGTVLAVGADGDNSDRGMVQVYDWSGSDWAQRGVDFVGTTNSERFGNAVSLSADGRVLGVGAYTYSQSRGRAFVYEWDGVSWSQRGSTFTGTAAFDNVGEKVVLSGDGTVFSLSAPESDDPETFSGRVSVYSWNGSSWVLRGSHIKGGERSDHLGESLSMSADGNVLAIGEENSSSLESVTIYEWTGSNWSLRKTLRGSSYNGAVSLSADGRVLGIGAYDVGSFTGLATAYELVDRSPVFSSLSTADFLENTIGTVLDVNVVDGDGGVVDVNITYSLAVGGDNAFFNIDESTGVITFIEVPDFELPKDINEDNVFNLEVRAGDGINNVLQQITITVTDVDPEPPIIYSFNIATFPENGTGTVIDINANDGEGGAIDSSVEYTLGGADAGDFDLTASGLLTFKQIPDYDAPEDAAQDNLYRLTVTAEKTGGSSTVQELTIVIIPLVEEGININNQLGTSISAEASGDHFGFSVSVNSTGQIMAVGGISNDGTGSNAGHVRVYEYQSSGWVQLGSDINGRAIGDELGRSVSLSYDGTLLAVGATGNDDVASNSGQVQVYRWNGSHWVEHGSRINGLSEDAFLGRSVSLNADGTVLAVGADGDNSDRGMVQVYDWSGSDWAQRGVDFVGTTNSERFGNAVSLSADGRVLGVGAYTYSQSRGRAFVYEWDGVSWSQRGSTFTGTAAFDNVGEKVVLSGDGTVFSLSAPESDDPETFSGRVSVYSWNGSSWVLRGSHIKGGERSDHLGESLSMSADGNVLAIGEENSSSLESVTIYEWTGSNWSLRKTLRGSSYNGAVSLSADGRVLGIGAYDVGSFTGLATAYELVDRSPVFSSLPTADFLENTIGTVLDVNVVDGDGGVVDVNITYSLAVGGDNAFFNIDESTGVITFIEVPDFELPKDINEDNVYHIQVTAFDGFNRVSQQITITVRKPDITAPVLVASNPADDAINFVGRRLTFTFDEDIVKGSGGIGVFDAANDSRVLVVNVGNSRLSVNGNIAVLNLVRPLPLDNQYYVKIQNGVFEDTSGNRFQGIFNSTALNFATPTTPQLVSANPSDDATEFNGTKLSLTFDRNMFSDKGRISIYDASNDQEILGFGVGSPRVNITDNVVELDLIRPLPLDKQVYVKIPPGALKDASGRFYEGIPDKTSLNFATATQLEMISSTPVDGATEFGQSTMTFTFNKDVFKGAGRISLRDATDDSEIFGTGVGSTRVSISSNVVTVNLVNPLPLNRDVYINIPATAFKDVHDNLFSGILDKTTLNFTSLSSLELLSSTPTDNASGFTGTTITLTFDGNVVKGIGRLTLHDAADDSQITGAGVGSSRVTIAGNVVTFDLIRVLPEDKQVYLRVPASAFKGVNGVFYEGILDKTTLNFATPTTPQLVSSDPIDEATEFTGTTITFRFDRNILKGSGRLSVFNAADDTEITSAGVASGRVTIVDNVVTFDLLRPLPAGTSAYVKVPASAFKDANNRFFKGMLDKTTLNFSAPLPPSESNPLNGLGEVVLDEGVALGLYPNPASREITIDLSEMGEEPWVRILGINGVEKFSRERVSTSQLNVDISTYAEGIYIVAVQDKKGHTVHKKFLIRR